MKKVFAGLDKVLPLLPVMIENDGGAIVVTGITNAGKTELARQVGARLGLPVLCVGEHGSDELNSATFPAFAEAARIGGVVATCHALPGDAERRIREYGGDEAAGLLRVALHVVRHGEAFTIEQVTFSPVMRLS